MSLDVAHGVFDTSHVAECPDVAPECATTFIPPHQHHVTLGLTHTELMAEYGARSAVAPSVYRELWTRGSAEQTFRQRTTWAISIVHLF